MENLEERFSLCRNRIREIANNPEVLSDFADYFKKAAEYLDYMLDLQEDLEELLEQGQLDELQQMNRRIYQDILPEHYGESYANPQFAADSFGVYGPYLSYLLAELYSGMPAYVFEKKQFEIVILLELFIEVYCMFEEKTSEKALHEALYFHVYDYAEDLVTSRIRETLDPKQDFAKRLIMEHSMEDSRYLYRYGEYISRNELELSHYLSSLPEEEIQAMAATYTQGFRRGFITMRIDMSRKKTVNIRYAIGQERIVKAAISQFEEMGLTPILNRYAVSRVNRRSTIKQGFYGTAVNPQFDYDHRMDDALFLDAAFQDRKLTVTRQAYESMQDLAAVYAGPAVIEVFGEKPFDPAICKDTWKYTDKQQKLSVEMAAKAADIVNTYIPGDEYSFTIIAYPLPEIGPDFQDIFRETVKVNTLDNDKYTHIQQQIVDALDQAVYVRVKGQGDNRTDMKVMLHRLESPEQQTNFENCVADVNIPVGEVFTSPLLTGTEGILNVSSVYLNGLNYKNLWIRFENGMVAAYGCDNYQEEEENQNYIRENLLQGRDTLPIGEFAIGTNTTAYVMARKYDIVSKLPILIVEKMGPHFAVGDTCYSHAEDKKVYNPDGKEIIARENECSALRKEDTQKAYFNCHTDITIPYDEIGGIYAVDENGRETAILEHGRFVLPGTEALNEVF